MALEFNKVCPQCGGRMASNNSFCCRGCFNLFNGRDENEAVYKGVER